MKIQRYQPSRAAEIADLFYRAVHAIDSSVYSEAQKEVWAPEPIDYDRWAERLEKTQPYMAVIDDRVVGFIELEADGQIDCMYTLPEFQGIGVASALYTHLVKEAQRQKLKRLRVDASAVARSFFEKRGFSVIRRNELLRQGVSISNVTMEKDLL